MEKTNTGNGFPGYPKQTPMPLADWLTIPGLVVHEMCHYIAGVTLGWHVTKAAIIGHPGYVFFEEGGRASPLESFWVNLSPLWLGVPFAALFIRTALTSGFYGSELLPSAFFMWSGVSVFFALPSPGDWGGFEKALKMKEKAIPKVAIFVVNAAYSLLIFHLFGIFQ
jgi:hypothetical protein